MAKIEQLTCPACGAHDVAQLSGINYQCNYCHSTFIVRNDNSHHKFNNSGSSFSGLTTDEILGKLKKGEVPFSSESSQTFHTKVDVKNTSTIKPAKITGFIVAIVIMVLVGVSSSVFTFLSKSTSQAQSFFSDWQKPNVDNYNCLVGSKGAVVWLVLKTQTNKLDSVKYWLRLIDPVTKKTISEEPLGKPKAWKELFNQSNQFDNYFYVANDTAYNVSEDGGVQGFNLYTGKRLFGNEWLEHKFPELKDGITKTDKQYYRKRIKLTSAAGDDFYYYPDIKKLVSEKEGDKSNSDEREFTEAVYLLQNKKSRLYLCTIKRRSGDDYYVSDSYVEQFNNPSSYRSSYIKDIKPINDVIYAKALPIKGTNEDLLFFYASDFSKHANGVLAMVNKKGNFLWRNSDTTFKNIVKDNTSDNIYLDYNLNKDLIVININKSGHQSVGVDLKTGKTKFVFNQAYSID